MKISERQDGKTMRKFNETQNWFFKKTPKIDKHLDRLMKKGKKNDEEEKEKDKTQITKTRN